MNIFIAVFLAVFSALVPTTGECSGVISNFITKEEKAISRRYPIISHEIGRLEAITSRPEVADIAKFLRDKSEVVIPQNREGVIDITHINHDSDRVEIVVILPEDENPGNGRRGIGAGIRGAVTLYFPGKDPLILFREGSLNKPWREINLLRAGIISAEILETKELACDSTDSEARLRDQARMEESVWGVVPELLVELKGSEFQNLVETEKKRLRAQGNLFRPPPMSYSRILNLLFGEPLSPFEEDFRETALWLSAVMEVIDEENPDPLKAQKERIDFLYWAKRNNQM